MGYKKGSKPGSRQHHRGRITDPYAAAADRAAAASLQVIEFAVTTVAGVNRTGRAVAWDIFDCISAETGTIPQADAAAYVDALEPILDDYRFAMLNIAGQGAEGTAPMEKVEACLIALIESLHYSINEALVGVCTTLAAQR